MKVKRMKDSKIYEDKISQLPDDILHRILQMLTIKESATTSILSRKWRSLWKTPLESSSNLDLDVLAMRGSNYPDEMSAQLKSRGSELLRAERRKFAGFIHHILELDHCSFKESCRLRFYLDTHFARCIDCFMEFALARRCQNLEIDLSSFEYDSCVSQSENEYGEFPLTPVTQKTVSSNSEVKWYKFPRNFPQEIVPCVKCLCLKGCDLRFSRSFMFASLVYIRLENVLIDNFKISNILSSCPDLEKLYILKCHRLFSLDIRGPSLKLKCLIVGSVGIKEIKIAAKMLSNFHYCGPKTKIEFRNVPQLTDVSIRLSERPVGALYDDFGKLSSHLPRLESLFVSVDPIEEWQIHVQLPFFVNLKKLVLESLFIKKVLPGTLWKFTPLLQACPHLCRLELHVFPEYLNSGTGLTERPSDFHHPCLEEIWLSGLKAGTVEIEFAKYLLNNAKALKRFTIMPTYNMGCSGDLRSITEDELGVLEKHIGSWVSLVKAAPPDVELLFC